MIRSGRAALIALGLAVAAFFTKKSPTTHPALPTTRAINVEKKSTLFKR
jgi:hypothetical protein